MNEEMFTVFPKLETQRLVLREVVEDDQGLIYSFNADPNALRFVAREFYTDVSEAVAKLQSMKACFHDKTGIVWTFALKETGEPIGYGGFFDISDNRQESEIGYGILKKFWGQGYVSEAVKEISDFGFKMMNFERIFGRVDPRNIHSARILEKLDYLNEGVKENDEQARGQSFDMTIWAKVRESE